MRLIGELDDHQQAEKFAAYLVTEGIEVQIESLAGGKSEIWVKDEDQFEAGIHQLQEFQSDSNNKKYSGAIHQAILIEREKERKRREIQKKIVKVGAGGLGRKPTLTLVLIGLCAAVALLTDFGAGLEKGGASIFKALEFVSLPAADAIQILSANGGNYDSLDLRLANIKQGQIWRLVTPIFIHHGTMHILFNMIWLYQLGKLIENRYGAMKLLVLVLLSAAISNLFQCSVPESLGGSSPGFLPDKSYLISGLGGMSGVVYGLLGFVWMKSLYDRSSGFYLPQSTLVIMLGWMLMCMVPGLTNQLFGITVANWAHAIGLMVGMAIGYVPVLWQSAK